MTAIENTFTLDVPSTTENLAMIREFVTRIGAQAGLTDAEIGQLELAVDEACANVIEHAYGDDKTKQVMVRAVFDEETLRIHVIDTGEGFDPTHAVLFPLIRIATIAGSGICAIRRCLQSPRRLGTRPACLGYPSRTSGVFSNRTKNSMMKSSGNSAGRAVISRTLK